MSLKMTKDEMEKFLADTHVGVVSVSDGERGPLAVPVWYAYEPGGELRFTTEKNSRKATVLGRVKRFSLCAQSEAPPYKYVSVEGPIVSIEPADLERDIRPMAHRYLGKGIGNYYVDNTRRHYMHGDAILVRMRPERWFTLDYNKLFE
jgi:nitroimidazol reductase NimA-like FMN-containing flavoprotein (pyridoxamine 5'-phosphate oxidase superfamily)